MKPATTRSPRRRDAENSRKLILQAALQEFSAHGHSGARVERIASAAGVSKPLLYDYFGDKDAIYAAALKEAYVQIREGEQQLALDNLAPDAAIRALVRFTTTHLRENPWFVAMLNTENLLGGATIRKIQDAREVQSILLERLESVLQRGVAKGMFRTDIGAAELYLSIASLCYFPVSNIHTLRAVFDLPIDGPWLDARADKVAEMLLRYLEPRDGAARQG